jgi:hypothetical protein
MPIAPRRGTINMPKTSISKDKLSEYVSETLDVLNADLDF